MFLLCLVQVPLLIRVERVYAAFFCWRGVRRYVVAVIIAVYTGVPACWTGVDAVLGVTVDRTDAAVVCTAVERVVAVVVLVKRLTLFLN
jgi:hypothetical protein